MPIHVLSALAEPTRLNALQILWDQGEHCACELMARLAAMDDAGRAAYADRLEAELRRHLERGAFRRPDDSQR